MLRPGELARIYGLQSQTALNGCEVRLLDERDGRWAAMCPSGKMVKVKPQNLEVASSAGGGITLQAFAARLRPHGSDEYSTFAAAELLEATQAEIKGSSVKLVDRSGELLAGPSGLVAVMADACRILASLLREATSGTRLVYLQRTRENSDCFAAAFALLKHSSALHDGGQQPVGFVLPGWLALHRDDFFFASPTYSATLSCRVLASFARGGGECCICRAPPLRPSPAARDSPSQALPAYTRRACALSVEHIYSNGPSTGLACGHVIHEACLHQCIAQGGPAPCCPLCREPMVVQLTKGSASPEPRQRMHDVAHRRAAAPLDAAPPAQHVEVDSVTRATWCCCIC